MSDPDDASPDWSGDAALEIPAAPDQTLPPRPMARQHPATRQQPAAEIAAPPAPRWASTELRRLGRALETEVMPRLLRTSSHVREGTLAVPRLGASIPELAGLVMGTDPAGARGLLEELRADGIPVESLYLDLLAPTARRLGELWEDDRCDFTDVTIGLGHLQQLLHGISPAFRHALGAVISIRRALLVPVPGEQHTFGLSMVADFLERAGWGVHSGLPATAVEVDRLVHEQWFTVLGLSMGSERHVAAAPALLRRIRKRSANPALGILVGGPLFAARPELARSIGADGTATDARDAVLQANRFARLANAHL